MVINDSFLNDTAPAAARRFRHWRDILYNEVDFGMPDSQLHSYAHTERVLLHALAIGEAIFGDDPATAEILAHAALFHDTRREDEYLDKGHGARGAVAYKKFCEKHPGFTCHPEAEFMMRYHDMDDDAGIAAIRKHFGDDAERPLLLYAIFKDADALDRWRLGSLGLDPRFLRTDEARARVELARKLVEATMPAELRARVDELVKAAIREQAELRQSLIAAYITAPTEFPIEGRLPWEITSGLPGIVERLIATLGDDFEISDGVATHRTAVIGHNVTIKAPAIIGRDCFVGSNSYLRNGVYMAPGAKVGISCEVKTTVMLENSAVAHFNFVGDSIIGHDVNIEAGAILANHFNEREVKTIYVHHAGRRVYTGVEKFGALVGDGCRIGANAVLSPGTLLEPSTIVRRLELIEQDPLTKPE